MAAHVGPFWLADVCDGTDTRGVDYGKGVDVSGDSLVKVVGNANANEVRGRGVKFSIPYRGVSAGSESASSASSSSKWLK